MIQGTTYEDCFSKIFKQISVLHRYFILFHNCRLAFIWKEVHVLADGAPTILTWRDTLIQLARNRNHMHWKEDDEMVGAAVAEED